MKKNMLFPRVSLLLALLFLGACSTNMQDEKKEIVSASLRDDAVPHPELAIIFSNIDYLRTECVEVIARNGEKITACTSRMNLSVSWDSLFRYKDSVETDYIRSLCSTHPERVLNYISISGSDSKVVFLNQSWPQINEEFAVLTAYFPENPIPGDTKPIEPSNGTTLVKLPLFSRSCEPLVKLNASKAGDTLKIESNDSIDYSSDCQCNFNISYTYNHADENINFVDIDGKIFPARYE